MSTFVPSKLAIAVVIRGCTKWFGITKTSWAKKESLPCANHTFFFKKGYLNAKIGSCMTNLRASQIFFVLTSEPQKTFFRIKSPKNFQVEKDDIHC